MRRIIILALVLLCLTIGCGNNFGGDFGPPDDRGGP